jgi:hypothetical protein
MSALDRIAILHELDRQAQEPGRPSLGPEAIAEKLRMDVPHVREQLQILLITERVELDQGPQGVEVRITRFGRQSLEGIARQRRGEATRP